MLPSRKSRCCETAGNVVNVGFDHHCDLSLVKVFINSRHVPYVLTTWHQKIFWILDLLTQGLLIKPVYDANKYSVTNTRNISPILLILELNYDPAWTRLIPYPAYETEHIHIKAGVQNPYPIYDQSGQNQLKSIPYLWPSFDATCSKNPQEIYYG